MRAVRERPRVALATVLGALALALAGLALGALLADSGPEVPQATQARLVGAERSARRSERVLKATRSELARVREGLARAPKAITVS